MKLKMVFGLLIALFGFSSVWAAGPIKSGGVTTDCAIQDCEAPPIPK